MFTNNRDCSLSCATLIFASLLSVPALADSGKGWDAFNVGVGKQIDSPSTLGHSVSVGAGKGWDVFRAGAGHSIQLIPPYMGTSIHAFQGTGWDVFRVGTGEPL